MSQRGGDVQSHLRIWGDDKVLEDRPMQDGEILGRVVGGSAASPVVLGEPAAIRKAGGEEIYVHAQYDMTVVAANNKAKSIGNSEQKIVAVDSTMSVGANQDIQVTMGGKGTIGADQTLKVGGNRSVEVNARVAALLELGAGFQPEFSGIDNVRMKGALLGMTRRQIDERLDDILAFADIGDYVYTIWQDMVVGRCQVVRIEFGAVNPQSGKPRSLIYVKTPGEKPEKPYPRKGHRGTRYYDGEGWGNK